MLGTGAMNSAVFFRTADANFGYLAACFEPGSGKEVEAQTKKDYQRLFAVAPINYFFSKRCIRGLQPNFLALGQKFRIHRRTGFVHRLSGFIWTNDAAIRTENERGERPKIAGRLSRSNCGTHQS